MKRRLATLTVLALAALNPAHAEQAASGPAPNFDLGAVAPALQGYTETVIEGDLWKRPDLAPRDRSIATISALIATGQMGALKAELNRALDDGVKPAELGAIITQLAFYTGWPNALSAVGVAKPIFGERGIGAEQLTAGSADGFPSTRRLTNSGRPASRRPTARCLPLSCATPTTSCLTICGAAQTFLRATAA